MGIPSEDTERERGTSIFRNITKADLLHGMVNRRSHYEVKTSKNQHESVTERVYQRDQTVSTKYDEPEVLKLSDIVDLERFVEENIK